MNRSWATRGCAVSSVYLLLKVIDEKWKDHLHAIDALRAGIGLRGYAQKDPKNEYKAEAFELFEKLFAAIEDEVAGLVLRVRVDEQAPAPSPNVSAPPPQPMPPGGASPGGAAPGGGAQRRPAQAANRPPAAAAFDVAARQARAQAAQAAASGAPAAATQVKQDPRFANVGRNDACPCGSGKKFKKCHGAG